MFNKYLITKDNGKSTLFLDVSNSFEFANTSYNNKNNNIYTKVYKYIKDNYIDFQGDRVNFTKNGFILGYIDLSDYDFDNDRYIETIDEISNKSKFIDFNKSNIINERLKIEEYVFKMVCLEMPAIFNEEALKAQAIISRTNLVKKLSNNVLIDDVNTASKEHLKDIWKDNYVNFYNKVLNAVKDTENEVIMYNGNCIDAYCHLASNGKTEDANNVLNTNYPYLVSVDSNLNNKYSIINTKIVSNEYLSKLLNMRINKKTKVNTLVKTIGNRVKYIQFDSKVFDGIVLSRRLGLDSNEFDVNIGVKHTTFTTYGYGNGLGLSKYGAENMANNGYSYREIIHHFYPNTYIEKV